MSDEKLMTMSEAIKKFVHDGDTLYMAGFTHLIPHSAGHEIIRQRIRHLTLCRPTPDLVFDQMIGGGCAGKVVFSWAGNPGVGPLRAFRRAVEQGYPNKIEIEEYSHFAMISAISIDRRVSQWKRSAQGIFYSLLSNSLSPVNALDSPLARRLLNTGLEEDKWLSN